VVQKKLTNPAGGQLRESLGGHASRRDRSQGLAAHRDDLNIGDRIWGLVVAAAYDLAAQGEPVARVEHAPAHPPGDGLGPSPDLGLGQRHPGTNVWPTASSHPDF
jgi:hypothetical protein